MLKNTQNTPQCKKHDKIIEREPTSQVISSLHDFFYFNGEVMQSRKLYIRDLSEPSCTSRPNTNTIISCQKIDLLCLSRQHRDSQVNYIHVVHFLNHGLPTLEANGRVSHLNKYKMRHLIFKLKCLSWHTIFHLHIKDETLNQCWI